MRKRRMNSWVASVRRSRSSTGLSVALHPPRRHLQQPPDRTGQQRRHLQMEGLPDQRPQSIQGDDARIVMSSIMRRRNGLMASSVMGMLLSWVKVAPHLKTGRPLALSSKRCRRSEPYRASGLVRCHLTSKSDVRFSNRPFGVKRFQTIHHLSVSVARGLLLLFGIGTKALPSWDSKTRWNNLSGGLAVSLTGVQADMRTHLIHRPARDIIPPRGGARVSAYRL